MKRVWRASTRRIEIFEDHSLIDLPSGMPEDVMQHLKTVWCAGQQRASRRRPAT
jgi:hypothetical protein